MSIDFTSQRRLKNFQVRKVKESLPEIFTSDFPKLVTFLEKYYNFLDSADGTHAFGDDSKQIFAKKDIHETKAGLLDNLVSELSGGMQSGEIFADKRFALTRLAELHRSSGSRFSAEEFFRLFFQETADIHYPKKDIFLVGDSASTIGVDSVKFIQNYERYQLFSILIKIGVGTSVWQELYKKFIHPAGFYFEGEVTFDGEALNTLLAPTVVLDSAVGPTIVSEALLPITRQFTQLTTLLDSEGGNVRVSDINKLVSDYQNLSLDYLDNTYHTLRQVITPNSFTFDDSGGRDSDETATPDFSNTLETMDNEIFTRYGSDSSF
tara:strand:- start:3884 stop:4849 length:966 start_codon:yes stop_codon:yes gene_type:complete